jgi:aryl-alcohol dehydrogenase-like predicted oxidoreductase
MQRRTFFGTAFAGLGTAATARPARAAAGSIPTRVLGKTGQRVTMIGMGGARFHMISKDEGVALVRHAYDLGITFFDMARDYSAGYGEQVYGAAIPPFRKDIFLVSKTLKRTRAGAEQELEASLRLMNTDHLDLWHMHGVSYKRDIDQIFGPGGAYEAFAAAKKAGKVRFIGYSNCKDPRNHVEMLKHAEQFDVAVMPLHVADASFSEDPGTSFEKTALPAAVERGVGIVGIKVFGNAFLLRTFAATDCLKFALSLPVTTLALGFNTIGQLEDNVRVAQNFKQFTPEEMAKLRARAASGAFDAIHGPALEYWKTRD